MDVVYVVRPGDRNEELRYSLRSLQNLPHDRVWIAGYVPSWVQNVGKLPVPAHSNKYRSAEANLQAACLHPEVSDPFYLFNDDFFVMQPMEYIPTYHRGPVAKVIDRYSSSSLYVKGMKQAIDLLEEHGIDDPLSYELHCPMPVTKMPMQATLSLRGSINCYHLRTVYGNLYRIGGQYSEDCKVYKNQKADIATYASMPLLSTADIAFRYHKIGQYIRQALPTASHYEKYRRAA